MSHPLLTSEVVSKVQQSPRMLQALPSVLRVPGQAEEDRASGQGGGGLSSEVRARPLLSEAEGWPEAKTI